MTWPHPVRRFVLMRSSLLLIARTGGDNYCGSTVSYYNQKPCLSTCRNPQSGRQRIYDGSHYSWCEPCIAADALGLPAHAHPERTWEQD